MKEVYIVCRICDYEYGCREIEEVFATHELAEEYIKNSKDNYEVEFWNGSKCQNLVILSCEVIEEKNS